MEQDSLFSGAVLVDPHLMGPSLTSSYPCRYFSSGSWLLLNIEFGRL